MYGYEKYSDKGISKRVKHPTWGVLPQGRNLKELAGVYTGGGVCGLIR